MKGSAGAILRRKGSAGAVPRSMGSGSFPRFSWTLDGAVLLVFFCFAVAHYLGVWPGVPFVHLSNDASNISSFVVARQAPDLFAGDLILEDPSTFRIYSVLHVPVLGLLERFTGTFSHAFGSLLILHVFGQALGFYMLGRVVFQSRYWATLLAVATLMPLWINLGEIWGVYHEALPRVTFQALLPFLLALAVVTRRRPKAWPWVIAGAGALVYVHPVSAPAWGAAIWFGMWTCLPREWSWPKRIAWMSGVGAAFFVPLAPFGFIYLANWETAAPGPGPGEYEAVLEILRAQSARGFFDVGVAVSDFVRIWGAWGLYWVLAGAGAVWIARRRDSDSEILRMVGGWLAGLLLVSLAIPWLDHSIARAVHRPPFQIDLIRGLRYLVPIMLLGCLWPLALAERHAAGSLFGRRSIPLLLGLVLVGSWAVGHPPRHALHTFRGWTKGALVSDSETKEVRQAYNWIFDALEATRTLTPPGARILTYPTGLGQEVRFHARRPVVFTRNDAGILGYSDHAKLLEWARLDRRLLAVEQSASEPEALQALTEFASSLGAEYLLSYAFESQAYPTVKLERIWSNSTHGLFRISDTTGAPSLK